MYSLLNVKLKSVYVSVLVSVPVNPAVKCLDTECISVFA